MADRYPNRPLPADNYGRGDQYGSGGGEGDPLAELARLIGQTDPFSSTSRSNPPAPPQQPPQYQPAYDAPADDEEPAAGPPQWMQRANLQRQAATRELPQESYYEPSQEAAYEEEPADYPNPVHPLHRYATAPAPAAAPAYQEEYRQPAYHEAADQADPARYDDALYGQLESGAQDFQREPSYPDDPYAYQDGYEDEPEAAPKRRGGLLTVAAVLALAVVGTGAAFAYRTYVGPHRNGEPPIIKADNTPIKIPAPTDNSSKNSDRLPASDGSEKMVPREETPVDVNTQASAGPRVVLPPLTQNANPPSPASVAANSISAAPPAAPPISGTIPNNEPRKIRTFTVHGDQPDSAAAPVTAATAAAPAPAKPATRQITRNAPPAANAPLSLSPDSAQASMPPSEPHTRVASNAPTQIAPSGEAAPAGEGHFLVSITSQPTEAEAQESFRSMQRKHPEQLASRSPIIKKVDKKGGGSAYRALVGPFASREEARQFCTSYSSAGGQCWVP